MRTARALTVSPSMLCAGGSAPGGSAPGGAVPAPGGGSAPGGCLLRGGIPACTEADPPPEQNHTRL